MFNPVALSNLAFDRIRLFIGIGGVAFAVLLVFINLGFLGALSNTAGLLYNQLDADIYLISPLSLTGTATKPFSRERVSQAQSLSTIQSASPLYIGYLPWRNTETNQELFILGYGFNPEDQPFLLPELRTPNGIANLQQNNSVFFDQRSLPKYGKSDIGHKTEVNKRAVTISGTYELGGGMAAEGGVMMNDQNFLRYFSPRTLDQIDLGLIQLKDGANLDKTVFELRKLMPSDVEVFSKEDMIQRDQKYWMEATAVGFIFSLGVGVALIVGAAIVYQILYADISKNFREYATLKAIGFHNRFLMSIVLQEAIFLAIMGFIPGLIISWGAYELILSLTNKAIPMVMGPERVLLVLILALATCILSGLLSLRKLITADPASVI